MEDTHLDINLGICPIHSVFYLFLILISLHIAYWTSISSTHVRLATKINVQYLKKWRWPSAWGQYHYLRIMFKFIMNLRMGEKYRRIDRRIDDKILNLPWVSLYICSLFFKLCNNSWDINDRHSIFFHQFYNERSC